MRVLPKSLKARVARIRRRRRMNQLTARHRTGLWAISRALKREYEGPLVLRMRQDFQQDFNHYLALAKRHYSICEFSLSQLAEVR